MAEKKATAKKATETKAAAAKKETVKKAAAPKAAAKKAVLAINAEAAGKALTVKEIAKAAKISEEETLLGLGWLFKEGKLANEGENVTLA